MTRQQKKQYQTADQLHEILKQELVGKKFQLDCGHHVTFGEFFGNDVIIRNNTTLEIICTQCGY